MRIEKTNSVNFNANFVNDKVKIKKLVKGSLDSYEDCKAYLVKIDCYNRNDINVLCDISRFWQQGNLATNIYYAACAVRNGSKYYKGHEVYALTTQKSDYNQLDCDKVLGLIHTSYEPDGTILIEQLQANPDIIYAIQPEYKGIGSGILASLKDFTNKICCHPSPASVTKFYEKNGFGKCDGTCNTRYAWTKNK